MRRPRPRAFVFTTALILAIVAPAGAQSTPSLSNPLPGSTRLPNGWAMDPAGTQVLTLRAPTGVTIAPDGSIYAVTSGIFDEGIVRVDPTTLIGTPTLVGQTYQGVAADAKGHVWVSSGGSQNAVYEYLAAGPALVDTRLAGPVPTEGAPNAGIAVTGYPGNMLLEGNKLFVAGSMSVPSSVARAAGGAACQDSTVCSVINVVDVSDPLSLKPAVRAVSVGRDAYGLAYRAPSNTLYVSNFADATNPARATGTVSVVKMNADGSGAQQQVYKVGRAPTGIALSPDHSMLAVANSDSDSVSLLSIGSDGTIAGSKTVDVRLSPDAPLGTAPTAVEYLPDGRLLVALSGIDALEMLDAGGNPIPQRVTVEYRGRTVHVHAPATYVPTAWYPDALAVGTAPAGGARVVVANLRGDGSGPGYYGQLQPLVGTSTEGTLSVIDLPTDARALAQDLNAYTARVVRDDELAPVFASLPDPAANACVGGAKPGGGTYATGILCAAQKGQLDPKQVHVVVIDAENKTFDSYFGDMKSTLTNADASPLFTEYGDAVTTNQHNLAKSFTLSDNFWNEGAEASTLGHDWLTGGYTTVSREITWGQEYDEGIRGDRSGGRYAGSVVSGTSDPASGAVESAMMRTRTKFSDVALANGLSVRIFGTDVNGGSPSQAYQVPQALWGEGPQSPTPGSDLGFPDTDRANMFLHGSTTSHAWDVLTGAPPNSPDPTKILPPPTFGKTIAFSAADKQKYTLDAWTAAYKGCRTGGSSDGGCQGAMPNYIYFGLPENHTFDVSNVFNPLDPTPQSMVADNDYALGLILQGLSQSPFWRNTIVFLTEDDNQFTGDHVDIHRTFLLTMGGLANQLGSHGLVSKQVGSFASVLKTSEVLLHLPPLSLFDWRATPLGDVVAPSLVAINSATYSAVLPPTPFLGHGVS